MTNKSGDITKKFGLFWKLTRRPSYVLSYIRGWLHTTLARAVVKTVGGMTATGELEALVTRRHLTDAERMWYEIFRHASKHFHRVGDTQLHLKYETQAQEIIDTCDAQGRYHLEDYGITSYRVVTNDFVAHIVDALQASDANFPLYDFMGYGTGSAAEAASDTALGTELTTQYATDNVRPTGTVSEPAANQFRIVTTLSPDANVTIQEAAPFTQAAVAGGIMMDRSLTGGQALVSGDSLQTTYTLSLTSGG